MPPPEEEQINEPEDYGGMFKKFCESSTVHGTYFWNAANTTYTRIMWIVIVVCGVGSAAYIINRSFLAWRTNPVITLVAQIPIEQVPFPSVTICPLGNTAFGYPEHLMNEKGLSKSDLGRALLESFLLLFSSMPPLQETHCLVSSCAKTTTSSDCENADDFVHFLDSARTTSADNYDQVLKNLLLSSFPQELKFEPNNSPSLAVAAFKSIQQRNCSELARDFLLLKEIGSLMSRVKAADVVYPGSLLKWLYTNLEGREKKREIFRSFFNVSLFPEAYSSSLGISSSVPLPELVEALTGTDPDFSDIDIHNLRPSRNLLKRMRMSLHPPHVAEEHKDKFGTHSVPNPAFPFCLYQDKLDEGLKHGPYNEHYCRDFQTTMNENGLCYTYNNSNQSNDIIDNSSVNNNDPVHIRNVKGCGKKKGLQLVVDSQKLATLPAFKQTNSTISNAFVVFVTVPGVITHKVPFTIDPSFVGEHHFYLHGIHFIDSTEDFKAWNRNAKACFFSDDRELKYFSSYRQDNCLLECRYDKIASRCHCAPYYLNQTVHPICGVKGNDCFKRQFRDYQEELQDREDCNCRSDCEGMHLFASMNRYPFSDLTATDIRFWWDEKEGKGRLANYLLDPLNVFTDGISKNITKLIHNVSDIELASKRFREDIAILNFFFDTPIITRITLEMRITVFDQIAAVGGSLGLFTGVSLITFVEVIYWGCSFIVLGAKRAGKMGHMVRERYATTEMEQSPRGIRRQYDKEFFKSNSVA